MRVQSTPFEKPNHISTEGKIIEGKVTAPAIFIGYPRMIIHW